MIRLTERPYLFVDETLIAEHNGTALRLHSPVRKGVAITTDAPWEGPSSAYFSVVDTLRQPDELGRTERYLLYYRGMSQGTDLVGECTCLAESTDGIEWKRRLVWKHASFGTTANNIVWNGENDISHNMAPFRDANPDAPAESRFKAIGGVKRKGVFALASPDGINWRLLSDSPMMTKGDFDSLNRAFWDSEKGCYAAYIRTARDGVRSIQRCLSDDFVHWRDPEWLDFGEGPPEQLYTNAIGPYERDPGLYLGFPKRFVPERTRHPEHHDTGVSDGILIASRDGLCFPRRFREAFIRPGLDQRNWTDRNMMMAPGMIRTSATEYSLYWSEHYDHHDACLVRGTIRVDGFASLHADWPGGDARTVPLHLGGTRLVLNMSTSAMGHVKVEIQDEGGRPIPGHTLADSDELFGDDVRRVVTWHGRPDNARIGGETVRLRFDLRDADVYSVACEA